MSLNAASVRTPRSSRASRRCQRRAITSDIVGLASAPSSRVASLRPRSAGLAGLTALSVEPEDGLYVMARGVDPAPRRRRLTEWQRISPLVERVITSELGPG